MFGNTSFGFSGAGGGGGGGTIGGGGTLNYLCKFTPDGLNIGNSMFFDNGISAGLGTITPDASALLDLTSTTQGFLSPRMTTVERDAIVAPVNGLFIYNTSSSFFNYWNGSTWIQIDTSTGGDVSGSGTTNRAVLWTDGGNSVIGDATWYYSTNDYLPVTTGSNIGDATHRIGTIFMASVFDYANDLTFYNGTSTTMTLSTAGNLGVGKTPSAKLDILQNTVSTGAKGLSVNFNTIGEVFSIDDNSFATYNGNNFTMRAGNAALNMISNGGSNPSISFKINNGAVTSGTFFGDNFNMFLQPNKYFGIGATYFAASSTLQIRGEDATNSNYALKVDNSASSPLFYVRNDGNAYMGNNTFVSVVSPISLDLGGQYSNVNGANPKLVIYNNGIGRSGLGVSYNGAGQTELFFRADSNAYDFTWYHGSSTLARLSPNTFTLHRNEPNLTYGYAINFDLNNSVGSQKTYAVISGGIVDNTNGSEDGFLKFFTTTAGTPTEKMVINEFGNVGIGTTSPTAKLQLEESSFTQEHLKLSGADFLGIASSTGGISMLLGVNTGNNRQLWIADSEALTPNATNSTLAFQLGGTNVPNIQALSTNATILNLSLQANGGNVGIGTSTPQNKLHVYTTGGAYQVLSRVESNATNAMVHTEWLSGGNTGITMGVKGSAVNAFTAYGANNTGSLYLGTGVAGFQFINADLGYWRFYNGTIDTATSILSMVNNTVGIGVDSASAKLQVKGVDETSSNYALKVDNSAPSPLLYVRNDGFVGVGVALPAYKFHVQILNGEIGTLVSDNVTNLVQAVIGQRALFGTTSAHDLAFVTTGSERMSIKSGGIINMSLQTGNAGLSSGDLYVDTAANILANGDLVVGRKV
jgi:hypothetical protein